MKSEERTVSTGSRTANSTSPPDVRRFWLVLLAVIAPLPMLAKAVYYLFLPGSGDDPVDTTIELFKADQDLVASLQWLNVVFVVGLVPAIVAVAWVSRRLTPRITSAGAFLAIGGFLAGFALLPNGDQNALLAAQNNLDVGVMTKLLEAQEGSPTAGFGLLGFFLGLLIGLPLLGVALWRSGVAPAWMGIALIVGTITHPFLSFSSVAVAVGLAVAAAGFGGATYALLRMSNDDFDLPAAGPRTT